MEGKGTFNWPEGNRKYEGEFKLGMRWGRGEYIWPDPNDKRKIYKYSGMWEKDRFNGIGLFTDDTHKTRKGKW